MKYTRIIIHRLTVLYGLKCSVYHRDKSAYVTSRVQILPYLRGAIFFMVMFTWEVSPIGDVTPWGLVIPCGVGSDNGLVPDGTKPLSEPTLSYQQGLMTFIGRAISQQTPQVTKTSLICYQIFQ